MEKIYMPDKIIRVLTIQLVNYEKNNKKHPEDQIIRVANSIREYGFLVPILIDTETTRVIVAGHARLQAAKRLMLKEVPCISAEHLTKDQIDAYRIIDNRLSDPDMAPYDKENLRDELHRLLDPVLFDLFVGRGLEKDVSKEDKEDIIPAVNPDDVIVKPGQIFRLGNHYLMCGDCTDPLNIQKLMGDKKAATIFTDPLNIQKLMGDKKAATIFTDPPYNVNYSGKGKATSRTIDNDHMENDQFDIFLDKVFKIYRERLEDQGAMYCFHSTTSQAQFELAIRTNGFDIKNQLIRNKPTASMGRGDYRRKHEPFFYCGLHGQPIKFYGDRTHTTIIDTLKGKKPGDILKILKAAITAEEEGMTTIRTMKRDKMGDYVHPTQKPVELITYALQNSTKINDIVVDFFGGSGSTLIACEKMQRECFCMELDPLFVQTIIARYNYYTEGNIEIVCVNDTALSINAILNGDKNFKDKKRPKAKKDLTT